MRSDGDERALSRILLGGIKNLRLYLCSMEKTPHWEPPQDLVAIEFFRASREKIEKFKEAVEKSDGLILLFVHPYFREDYEWSEYETKSKEKAERTMERIDKFISSKSPNRPPVIVFEESKKINETENYLREIAPNSEVLITPTIDGTSLPALPGSNHVVSPAAIEQAWLPMIKSLKYLGVKKILVGGMMLDARTWTGERYLYLSKCVGAAHDSLKKDFDVEVSSFAFPLARKDIYAGRNDGEGSRPHNPHERK